LARHSWYVPTLFIILFVVLVYSFSVFLQNQTSWFLTITLIWAIILPLISDLPYSGVYWVSIPSPFLGILFGLMSLVQKYIGLSVAWFLLVVLVSFTLVIGFHIGTRKRAVFWKFQMSSLSRLGIATSSVIFLALAMAVIYPSILATNLQNELFYFTVAILGYITTSMLYINSSYRYYVLSDRIGTNNLEKYLSGKWKNIEKRFSSEQQDLDLLQYYFHESYTSFLEGDFEKSFVWGYKVIREKTVVNPTEFVDDKREDKPSFSEIRNTLQHSRREDTHIGTQTIKKVMKNLCDDALDLLEREITFIKKVAE